MIEADANLFLQDFGLSVTAGAVSGIGVLDQNSEIVLGGQVISVEYSLTCISSLFGNLKYGDAVVVNGVNYTVQHQPMRLDDGLFCMVSLQKA
jgi:hypothetical protein